VKNLSQDTQTAENLLNDKDAIQVLLDERNTYHQVLQYLPYHITVYDEDDRLVFVNDKFLEGASQLGYSVSKNETFNSILHKIISQLHPEASNEEKNELCKIAAEKHKKATISNQPIEISYSNENYELLYSSLIPKQYRIVTHNNINVIKQQELLLREILYSTNQGIIICGKEKTIDEFNLVAAKIWGIDDEAKTQSFTIDSLMQHAHKKGIIASHIKTEEEWRNFEPIIHKTIQKCREDAVTIPFDNGQIIKMRALPLPDGREMHTYFDITDIEKSNQTLTKAMKDAEAAEKTKSEFLANMSHEIRTPMNGVMGMAELLLGTSLDQKQQSFAQTIVNSGAALLTIINDILDFSKIDSGQMTLNPAPFRLSDAIEDVATLMSSTATDKNIELAVRLAPDLPHYMKGDVGRIRQIITNLLGNALKFTHEGYVLIDVGYESVMIEGDTPGAKLLVKIIDSGIGISEENREKVFKKFMQVDGSAARQHEGTGLGLAITSSLIELMDGKIGLDSVQGEGSTFWFEITLPIESHTEEMPNPINVAGARILIIDDNEVNRAILTEQMDAWTFTSKACESGEKGIEMLLAAHTMDTPFDLIILDHHMPLLTGAQVAEKIRADDRAKNVPIIMLTSVDLTEDGKHFASLDIQSHLTKPARSSLLLETIIEILQTRKSYNVSLQEKSTLTPLIAKKNDGPSNQSNSEKIILPTRDIITDSNHKKIDILIAEDNEVNQIVFTQSLESFTNYSFKIAPNGKIALELFQQLKPDLILMDVSMPVMNGHDATRKIREVEKELGKHTPIIGVTAHAITNDKEKCFEAGMDDYLSKPISPKALIEKITKWLSDLDNSRTSNTN